MTCEFDFNMLGTRKNNYFFRIKKYSIKLLFKKVIFNLIFHYSKLQAENESNIFF